MTKRAIVYARVSTDEQAERGFSLSAQIEAGRRYAEVHGMIVTNELIDDGVSGARAFSERPSGAVARTMLRQRQADALVVQNVDRLSRDVVDLLVTIRELLRAGIEVHCLDLGRVTSEYDIMLVIRGWQGSDERAKIRERSMRGKREKLTQGMIAAGRLPYGYAHERDPQGRIINFKPNEEQAEVVRLIFQLFTRGDDKNPPLSLYRIAKHLSAAGVPAPSNTLRTRGECIWCTSAIMRILKRSTYKGEWTYHASDTDEDFVISVPPLVDTQTWEAAQVQIERNKNKAKRNAKADYLLSGLIVCEVCGSNFTGIHVKPYRYYRCCHKVRLAGLEPRKCEERALNADALEAATWDVIRETIANPPKFKAKLLEAQQAELEEHEPQSTELAAVETLIAEAEKEAIEIGTALRKATGIVEKTLERQQAELDARYTRLTARRDELKALLANRRLTDEAVDAILQFAADMQKGLEHADLALRRQMLDTFNAHITVKDGKATLHYGVSVPTSVELQLHSQSTSTESSPRRRLRSTARPALRRSAEGAGRRLPAAPE